MCDLKDKINQRTEGTCGGRSRRQFGGWVKEVEGLEVEIGSYNMVMGCNAPHRGAVSNIAVTVRLLGGHWKHWGTRG